MRAIHRGRNTESVEDGKESWEEEREVAKLLEDKIIRKVSIKRWIEERHKFYPTLSAVERLRVEEGEEQREKIWAQEGWQYPTRKQAEQGKRATRFHRAKRTRWEQAARLAEATDQEAVEAHRSSCAPASAPAARSRTSAWPLVDLRSADPQLLAMPIACQVSY